MYVLREGGGGGTNDYLDYSIAELKTIVAVQNASVKRYIFTGGSEFSYVRYDILIHY